jgi:hypothetical protein
LFYAILSGDWKISGTLFHVCGPIVGILALRHFRLPKYTWIVAECVGAALYVLARLLTDEALNVNAAFRVYEGWEGIFSNYAWYVVIMLVGYGAFFFALPYVTNRFLFSEETETKA